MLNSRSTRLFGAVLVMTALTFTLVVPLVNACPDVYRKLRTVTDVYSNTTGELCYTVTVDYPPKADTQTKHYKKFHKNKTTIHTHIYTTYIIEHHYTQHTDY